MAMQARPAIPSTRLTFVGQTVPRVAPSIGETVAIPLVHDWGPLGSELTKPEVMAQFAEWTARYGDSDTDGRTGVIEAFIGEGVLGRGGAGGVIPYRMGANAARAAATVQNTRPANAVTIAAKWCGTRGNDYSFVIDADPADSTNRQRFRLKYLGAVVETYTYPVATPSVLVDAINARDVGNITAALLVDGVALAATSGTSLVGGDDGDTLTSSDYMDALDGLEFQPFTLLAPANLDDAPIEAAIVAWVQAQEAANRPVRYVVGGAAGETLDTAIARTAALADPHVLNFGVGTFHDDAIEKDLSTAQLAPRIAGIVAARGKKAALTGALLGGLHAVGTTGITADDAATAVQRGVICAIRTDDPDADLRIAQGLTTFTATSDPNRPLAIFSEPRFIGIMDMFVRDMRQWGDRTVIGSMPNNQDTRDAVKAKALALIDQLLSDGLILTRAGGATEDPFVNVPVSTNDALPFEFGWQFAYTTNFLLGQGTVR